MIKTNTMRLLDSAKISYRTHEYEFDNDNFSTDTIAEQTGMAEDEIFKTLVTKGDKTGINIFCIPINSELDLKKAAIVSKNKKIEMILMKDLLSLTGYMRGCCSPIGMKKKYPTFIDETAILFDEIAISGGAKGLEIIINPEELSNFIDAIFTDLV